MKKISLASLVLLVLALSLAFMSCASKSATKAQEIPNTPPWINDFPPEDVLWGIGTAKQSSESMSMTTAEARARVAIARQISTKVQAMFTDYNLDAGNVKNQANTSLQEDVSRQITDTTISGARPIQKWKSPANGTWWYLVEMKKSDVKSQVSSILKNEEATYAQFKTQQALQMLDAQLAKNEKPVQIDN